MPPRPEPAAGWVGEYPGVFVFVLTFGHRLRRPTIRSWQNERFFRLTAERFAALLAGHAAPEAIAGTLLACERRNLEFYGYGIKSFTLSMIETAVEVTGGRAPASVIGEILAVGRDMLRHPVETLPPCARRLSRSPANTG